MDALLEDHEIPPAGRLHFEEALLLTTYARGFRRIPREKHAKRTSGRGEPWEE